MKRDALTIGLVASGHAVSHFFQLVLAPLFPLMSAELGVSYSSLGVVLMLFFAVSAVLQPFAGFLVDRVGGRGVLLAGIALMAVGILVMSSAGGVGLLVAGALLMGVGNSVFHPADFAILNGRVSQERLGYAFSAHGIGGQLGFAAAPVFSAAVAAGFGWRAALLAAAALGALVLLVLIVNAAHLHAAQPQRARQPFAQDARVLLSAPVLVCFAFFAIWGASYAGLSSFAVTAMQLQFGVAATLASSALTGYMLGNASGMLLGGVVAARTTRHDLVAASGFLAAAVLFLMVATATVGGAALPIVLGLAGFFAGLTYPSRDLIVRASTPPGAAGRVYGFVYSGLDFGSFATPMFYGMLIDHGQPQAVFYAIFGFTLLAILTVLQLPGRRRAAAAVQRT